MTVLKQCGIVATMSSSSQFIIIITKEITNKDNWIFVPIFKEDLRDPAPSRACSN